MNKANNFHLQLLSRNHGESFYRLIQRNLTRLEDFFAGTVRKTKSLKDTIEYCLEIEQRIKDKTYFPYLIIETNTNKLVGFIDLKNIDWDIPKGELGAFIDLDYEGYGIITHHGKALINQIVEKHHFKKLFCRVSPKNKRSIQVIERIGFELEGTLRRDYKTIRGELVDLNYYSKLYD